MFVVAILVWKSFVIFVTLHAYSFRQRKQENAIVILHTNILSIAYSIKYIVSFCNVRYSDKVIKEN